MSNEQTYTVTITVGDVVGDSPKEAFEEARALLRSLAESNDGAEILANAAPVLTLVSR